MFLVVGGCPGFLSKYSLITLTRHIRYNLVAKLGQFPYYLDEYTCCCRCLSLFPVMGKKSGRTNKQIKWFRHCSRQQTKQGKDGDTRSVVLVEHNDTRVVLKPSQEAEELTSLSKPGPSCEEEPASQHKPLTAANREEDDADGLSTSARGSEEDDEGGDDVLSIHADSDPDI